MKQNKMTARFLVIICLLFVNIHCYSQSFNDEKVVVTNYVKRMYLASSFEGAKLIEGEDRKYYVVAITLPDESKEPSSEKQLTTAEHKAEESARSTFAEPCIKLEMLVAMPDQGKKKTTFLFLCQPLSEFVVITYKQQPFDGAKLITTPNSSYLISGVTLENKKYASAAMMDRVAQIKAKSQASIFFNGSTISSDMIITTSGRKKDNASEMIREQSMGFVDGLENLVKFDLDSKKVYFFYKELKK
ncbi:hypothetical protein CJD36_020205 [Flavipsychrobacter stenotrophus]|uniref:Uncharacterized protein n=1 Tax=Flavipsychrobacter stenotrophus TaxID=2077091 RepID=A0A2S7SQD9_9BACT|nr:hypothetical protein [Flavipsychrobacter stenotrophus]PQJ09123.1 hypothetical protein CJD36_020205 [Flavipsychrobacter stenotrophus]